MFVNGVYNHRVSVFDIKGTYLHCFGTEENGENFDRLHALAVTSATDGYLYISDIVNNKIVVFF